MTRIPFTQLVGTGNDFVLVDTLRHRVKPPQGGWARLARLLCDPRRTGTDGLLVLGRSPRATLRMRIFNPDGSEAEMCGNGIRCLASYAHRQDLAPAHFTIETKAGVKRAEVLSANRVRVNMGAPRLLRCLSWPHLGRARDVEADLIESGVPHLVCWVTRVDQIDVDALGRRLRRDRRFQPRGANVDFVQPVRVRSEGSAVPRARLRMRTYERGVEGETQACGTGAVAAAAAWVHTRMVSAIPPVRAAKPQRWVVEVVVPGGVLQVSLSAARRRNRLVFSDALLEGAVKVVSHGVFPLNPALKGGVNGRSPA